jgi:uncharacterized membrane protein
MAAMLSNLRNAVVLGFVLAVVLVVVVGAIVGFPNFGSKAWWAFAFRWLHVLSGILWIGLLYYFNFVQIPTVPKIPAEMRPAIGKFIAPEALFWFRWAAMATLVTGLVLAHLQGYLGQAIVLGIGAKNAAITTIGIGMWLGTIMWFNVWFVIWPNQKKALGIVQVPDDQKAKAARTAMLFSRTNFALSVPMLYCMVAAQNGGLG